MSFCKDLIYKNHPLSRIKGDAMSRFNSFLVLFLLYILFNKLPSLTGPQLARISYQFHIISTRTGRPLPNAIFYWKSANSAGGEIYFNNRIIPAPTRKDGFPRSDVPIKIGESDSTGMIKFQTHGVINGLEWEFPEIGNLDISNRVLYITRYNCKPLLVKLSDTFPNLPHNTRHLTTTLKMQCG